MSLRNERDRKSGETGIRDQRSEVRDYPVGAAFSRDSNNFYGFYDFYDFYDLMILRIDALTTYGRVISLGCCSCGSASSGSASLPSG